MSPPVRLTRTAEAMRPAAGRRRAAPAGGGRQPAELRALPAVRPGRRLPAAPTRGSMPHPEPTSLRLMRLLCPTLAPTERGAWAERSKLLAGRRALAALRRAIVRSAARAGWSMPVVTLGRANVRRGRAATDVIYSAQSSNVLKPIKSRLAQ